jgi:hypothetical protein
MKNAKIVAYKIEIIKKNNYGLLLKEKLDSEPNMP